MTVEGSRLHLPIFLQIRCSMQPRDRDFTSDRIIPARLGSEELRADIDQFLRTGGEIERLGNTPFRKPEESTQARWRSKAPAGVAGGT